MSGDAKTSMPVEGMNPMSVMMIGGFQAVCALLFIVHVQHLVATFTELCLSTPADTGIMFAVTKYVDLESKIPLPFKLETTMAFLVLLGGLITGWQASYVNWARVHYKVPWPHTFAPDSNKEKLKFDMIQRASINFTENYTQFLCVSYLAANMAPKSAAVFGFFYLLGRIVFSMGYYSGDASKKDNGAFGYMIGIFPQYGLAWLFFLTSMGLVTV